MLNEQRYVLLDESNHVVTLHGRPLTYSRAFAEYAAAQMNLRAIPYGDYMAFFSRGANG